jgi:hypothetical protein
MRYRGMLRRKLPARPMSRLGHVSLSTTQQACGEWNTVPRQTWLPSTGQGIAKFCREQLQWWIAGCTLKLDDFGRCAHREVVLARPHATQSPSGQSINASIAFRLHDRQ